MSGEHVEFTAMRQNNICLKKLPTELLYRICDFLDTETLLLSFRRVCLRFYEIANSYAGYKVRASSKSNRNICRLIRPENVISLDICDDDNKVDWIQLFLPKFENDQFIRLRSLRLPKIGKHWLDIILQHATKYCKLTTFAMSSDFLEEADHLLQLLSPIICQPTLDELILHVDFTDRVRLKWPIQCGIKKLLLNTCTFQQLCCILQNSPNLHNLTMNYCHMNNIDEIVTANIYNQLTSLTLNDLRMTMDQLELLLSVFPSITHLDLSSTGKPFVFIRRLSEWEQFLKVKLPRLDHFEFCIFCFCTDWLHFEAVINAFRTPFWLNEKRWFVTCQFRDDWTSSFTIFTSSESSINSNVRGRNFDKVIC